MRSIRATIWVFLSTVLVMALIAFFVRRGGFGRAPAANLRTPVSDANQTVAAPQFDGTWPMFHGGQGLLGRAQGTLADSLTLLWKFKTGAEVKSSAAIEGGRVFIGSCDNHLYALDLRTGEKLWSYEAGDAVESSPCVLEGRVFVGSSDDFLHSLDAGTGELKWRYETDGQILGSPNWTRSPDGHKTWIVVGSYDNRLHCVDAESGKAVWTYETGNYVNGSPAVDQGKCAFGGCDAMIHVVSLADGRKVAEIDSGSYIAGSGALLDGQVFVGNHANIFLCADLNEGRIRWRYEQSDAAFFSSPAVGEDVVVFGGRDEYVHCVRRDRGQRIWAFKTLGEVNSSPVICGDKIVVGSDDGRLYLLRLADGARVWSYEMGQPVTSSPAVVGGLVVTGCDDGYVYAFGPKQADGGPAQ